MTEIRKAGSSAEDIFDTTAGPYKSTPPKECRN
jgi:hypothetical protein